MRGRIVQRLVNPLFLASGLVMLFGCSGSQQEDENLEASGEQGEGNENANLGQDDAAEGNGQENYVDNNEGAGNNQGDSANVNSAAAEEPPPEQVDTTLDNSAAATPPINNAVATPPPAPPAPAAGGEGAPVPGGRVRYVKEGGVQAVNAPGGQPVMMLEQGEHPVTWEENGYLRIANGVYVPVDALSDKGVARPQSGGTWSH